MYKFGEFIDFWMEQPRAVRKELSYSGALRSSVGDPVHYVCQYTRQGYFDPSNMIYSMAMCFLAPQLSNRGWNIETRGDIFESLIGYSYKLAHKERADALQVGPQAHCVACIIEVTSILVYKLWIHSGKAFDEWCVHILVQAHCIAHCLAKCVLPQQDSRGPGDAPRTNKRLIALAQ